MSLREYIKNNRDDIDRIIRNSPGIDWDIRLNDSERRLWILNDEELYYMAKQEGVRI